MDNLSIVGVKVKVKLNGSEVLGYVYAYLPDEDLILLTTDTSNQRKYIIVRTSKASLVILDDGPEQPLDLVTPSINSAQFQQLEQPSDGARIYTELGKTYRVNWNGPDIVLPDLEMTISPPYQSARDITGSPRSMARMVSVLQKLREKLGLD